MKWTVKAILAATTVFFAAQAAAQITFYEHDDFRGRTFSTDRQVLNFAERGFNDHASSVIVDRGSWEACSDERFGGRCVVLRRGSYSALSVLGMNDKISSVRPVSDRGRYQNEIPLPPPAPVYEYRQRPSERTYEAPVTSVRAVFGPPEQRCWVERQQVTDGGKNDAGGAILGAIIGGVLGHQVGGGRGKDVATAGGAVAGALIGGNNSGNSNAVTYDQDVQRCRDVGRGRPAYWEVFYTHRGVEHRIQMSSPPGNTILVNRDGIPRQ